MRTWNVNGKAFPCGVSKYTLHSLYEAMTHYLSSLAGSAHRVTRVNVWLRFFCVVL
jgi:hypothetical protein